MTYEEITGRLLDVSDGATFNHSWAEGYISALADQELISENAFDELIEFIKAQ